MSEKLTYAKVDGPPDDWQNLTVTNLDTGEPVLEVREVNTVEGWVIKFVEPLVVCSGSPKCPACDRLPAGEHARLEKINGTFKINRPRA